MLGGTLLLAILWVVADRWYPDSPYLYAVGTVSFIPPYLISLRYTSLKGQRGSVQAIVIGGQLLAVQAIVLGAAWLSTRI
jgi:hypothetical protein